MMIPTLPRFALIAASLLTPFSLYAQEPATGETAEGTAESSTEILPEAAPATAEDYVTAVVTRINAVKLNVAALREAGMTGRFSTRVEFVTGNDGRLVSSKVLQSSGNTTFDNVAMAQIRAAEPFPLFAPDMGDADRSFTIDIATDLSEPEPEVPATGLPDEAPAE